MTFPTLTWDQARAIAQGALPRAHMAPDERAALASLIEQVAIHDQRPECCTVHQGSCCDCPQRRFCPFGKE